jgi:NADH:ubiquinone oxidoreductase subunit D
MEEMRQSNNIIWDCANSVPEGKYSMFEKPAYEENNSMESIINHFKYYFESIMPAPAFVYVGTEAPKGEFGVNFIADGTNKPYRCKFRAPGFYHLQGLPAMAEGGLLADLVTVIGTQDLVFGEIDK